MVTGVVPSSPRFLPSIFVAHRFQQSRCSSIFHGVLISHALALSVSQLAHKKKSLRIYTSMHSGRFELTKLAYARLDNNLTRHRGDRSLLCTARCCWLFCACLWRTSTPNSRSAQDSTPLEIFSNLIFTTTGNLQTPTGVSKLIFTTAGSLQTPTGASARQVYHSIFDKMLSKLPFTPCAARPPPPASDKSGRN